MSNRLLRFLPSIERMLLSPTAVALAAQIGRDRVRDLLREICDEFRSQIAGGPGSSRAPDVDPELLAAILDIGSSLGPTSF